MKPESLKMKLNTALATFAVAVVLLISDPTQLPESFFTQAEAIIGRPLTPFSFAGVGRRMARRSIYAAGAMDAAVATDAAVTSAAYSTADANAANTNQQAADAEQTILPIGSTLPSLPSGCDSSTVDGKSYFTCGGNWYRPAMQNGNIVYSVVANPG